MTKLLLFHTTAMRSPEACKCFQNRFLFAGEKTKTVDLEKQNCRHQGDSHVATEKGMVANKTIGIKSG